eukprot:g23200.t1
MFLRPGTASILPQIQQATQQWKQQMEKHETTQSLRLCLVMLIAQTLLDRMLKIAQAATTSEIWQEAVKHMILTEHGGWNFLTWNAKEKRMQPTDRAPISMTSMQSMLEELVELIRDPQAVVRFKCLKASDSDSKQLKVMPWMLQVSMRHQRLHELLQTLSTSATTGTTESSPLSTENSSEVRQLHQRWHWSRCRWICCALVVTFVLLIVTVIGVNHAERSELLEPMLDPWRCQSQAGM